MRKTFLIGALTIFTLSSAYASCDDTALHAYMHDIKDELKAMAKDVKAGNNNEALKHADVLIATFKKSRLELPYQFTQEGLEGDELAAQSASYHKMIDGTIGVLGGLEVALKADDSEQIKALLGALGQQRKIGHRAFKQNC